MQQLLNTLYVTTPNAYLRLEGNTLCVMVEKKKRLQVPLHHLGGIVCFGDTMMTPALMQRCAGEGRTVVWMDRNGRFQARLEGPVNGNVLLRQAQHRAAADNVKCVELARTFIAGKLQNSRQVLMRGARDSKDEGDREALSEAAKRVAGNIRKLASCADLDGVRGCEGDGARIYFAALPHLIRAEQRPSFPFTVRTRRPPRDPFNAMLSFLYTLLVHDCRSALEGVGLDPRLGFLHAVRPGRPALALDLMEEFRSVLADRLAFTLVNRNQLGSKHFEHREGGSVQFNDEGRQVLITSYQNRKKDMLTHPLLEQPVLVGLLPHLQARLLARVLRRDIPDYVPYLQR